MELRLSNKSSIMKQCLLTLLTIFMTGTMFGQDLIWSDDFEDTGSPSSGVRTPSNNIGLGDPSTLYFKRTTNSQIDASFGSYTGLSGTTFWAGENHGGLFGAGNEEQNIVFSSINISGKTGLTFKGLFAANNQSAAFENMALGFSHSDYMIVEYAIDGGAYLPLFNFFANNNTASGANNKALAEDTNNDGIGDGTLLTTNFTTFTKAIVGTGTTLRLRIRSSSNGGNEEMAFDNFQLLADACVPPVVTANPPNRFICVGGNTTFGISATGATAYQWQVDSGSGFSNVSNGGVYSGATTTTLSITAATAAMAGYVYRCVAINGTASCSANSNGATLSISNMITSGSLSNVSCNGGTNGAAAVSVAGGATPYSYSWSPSGGNGSVATGLAAGTYTVTITDNIGCETTRSFTITQPTAPLSASGSVIANVSCRNGNDGALDLTVSGGTAPYTYAWSNGATTQDLSGLTAGTYNVTVTDNNGCTTTKSVTIIQPSALTATSSPTNVSCNASSNGTIDLTVWGGNLPYTYAWSNGATTQDLSGLTAGTYNVTVTDNNGCITTESVTITEPSALTAASSQTNVSCNGSSNGDINLTVSGGNAPYTYAWNNGATTDDLNGLTAGTYNVTFTDNNGCTTTESVTITEPRVLAASSSQTNGNCNGSSNGAIDLTVSGGNAPYTYTWDNGATTQDLAGLTAGTYNVTVTDNNGCTTTESVTITEPSALIAASSQTNVNTYGDNDGTIDLTVSGGTAPYTYTWDNGATTQDLSGLTAGTYNVTVTDNNGCMETVAVDITEPAAPVAALDQIIINGTLYTNPSDTLFYTIDCVNTTTSVTLDLVPAVGATMDTPDHITIAVPSSGTYTQNVTVTSGDGFSTKEYQIIIEKRADFETLVVQKFNNLLLVNNNPATNGGYSFVSYQWYKNGIPLGNGQYYSAGDNATDLLDENATYSVQMITSDGKTIRSCEQTISLRPQSGMVLYPTMVGPGGTVTLSAPENSTNDRLETQVFDLSGGLIRVHNAMGKEAQIVLPQIPPGVYLVKGQSEKGSKTFKIIVK